MLLCLPVYLSVCLSACISVCLSVCLPVYLSVCLSAGISVCLPVCLPVCLSACLSVYLSVGLSNEWETVITGITRNNWLSSHNLVPVVMDRCKLQKNSSLNCVALPSAIKHLKLCSYLCINSTHAVAIVPHPMKALQPKHCVLRIMLFDYFFQQCDTLCRPDYLSFL